MTTTNDDHWARRAVRDNIDDQFGPNYLFGMARSIMRWMLDGDDQAREAAAEFLDEMNVQNARRLAPTFTMERDDR